MGAGAEAAEDQPGALGEAAWDPRGSIAWKWRRAADLATQAIERALKLAGEATTASVEPVTAGVIEASRERGVEL